MQNIALPKKIEFLKGEQANQEAIVIEPLYPGYGMTLGNSLRRVLLSSLPGAAVTGVKIKGVSHEFMALPHIKEDVLELILNLKQLRLHIFSEEEIKLELKVKGKKKVTAADIKGGEVEIKNPDLVIANITDETGSLEMEIYVKGGRGYKMSEGDKKENKDINFIEIDSIFSPVLSVSIDVENARVGKMTNWDKLVLNVKTDGTISPRDAFEESVKILVEQFSSLLASNKIEDETEEIMPAMILDEEPVAEVEEEETEIAPKKVKKEKDAKPKKTKK